MMIRYYSCMHQTWEYGSGGEKKTGPGAWAAAGGGIGSNWHFAVDWGDIGDAPTVSIVLVSRCLERMFVNADAAHPVIG